MNIVKSLITKFPPAVNILSAATVSAMWRSDTMLSCLPGSDRQSMEPSAVTRWTVPDSESFWLCSTSSSMFSRLKRLPVLSLPKFQWSMLPMMNLSSLIM